MDIAQSRLQRQRLVGPGFDDPATAVAWFGAVQSQDYPGAKWALALRMPGWDSAALDEAFDAGAILRTHVMRPTWHFVAPEDIRWLLQLTGPRVQTANAHRYRQLELDEATRRRSEEIFAEAVRGQARTRHELGAALQAAKIGPEGQRLPHLIMHAELEGVICSGPMRGKQHTYALLDERAPNARSLPREEAIVELVRRYFTSHGPATLNDFAWWSGLTVADGRRGLAALGSAVEQAVIDGKTYWTVGSAPEPARSSGPVVHLLPNYDEHLVAYRDHGPSIHPNARSRYLGRIDLVVGPHSVVVDGLGIGGWRRIVEKGRTVVDATLIVPLDARQRAAAKDAAERFATFLGQPVELRGV